MEWMYGNRPEMEIYVRVNRGVDENYRYIIINNRRVEGLS